MACLYKEWWVSLTASVLSKEKDYFRNVLTKFSALLAVRHLGTAKCADNSLLHSTRVANYAISGL